MAVYMRERGKMHCPSISIVNTDDPHVPSVWMSVILALLGLRSLAQRYGSSRSSSGHSSSSRNSLSGK